ncbi:hypothetical protein [uncultured Eubacterium sp.]|uniref:hypothetical protein n=1 Tax=uncultured Eubacterium sp. TaxID=165185 RepID=UPI0032645E6D
MSDFVLKWKSFVVYVLCCFLLCNSVLADFEAIADGDGVASGGDSGISDVPGSSVSDVAEDLPNENETLGEKVDTVIDSIPALGEPSVSDVSPGELSAELSPGGNTVYVVGGALDDAASSSNPVLTNAIVTTGLAPVTPGDTSGVKAVLLSFIGDYDPPIVQYEYTSNNNYKSYVNGIQPDYVWICSFALIALFIYCLFKLGGGLLRG